MVMKKSHEESWFEEISPGSVLSALIFTKNPSIKINGEYVDVKVLQVMAKTKVYVELVAKKDLEPKLYMDGKIIEESSELFDK